MKAPFLATQDIAEVAAEFLLKPIDGHHVIDIVGPQEISFDEWDRIAGQAIGKQIRVVTVPGDKLKAAMSQAGMSPEMAALLVEMEEAYPKYKGTSKAIRNAPAKLRSLNLPGKCLPHDIRKPRNRPPRSVRSRTSEQSDVWERRIA